MQPACCAPGRRRLSEFNLLEALVAGANSYSLMLGTLVCFLAAVLQGYTGFGSALIMFPLMTVIYPPVTGIAIAAIVGSVSLWPLFPNAIRSATRREIMPLLAATLLATYLGTLILIRIDPFYIRLAIGLFVILAAILMLENIQYRGPRGKWTSIGVGVIAGFLTGSLGVPGGPILVLYFLAADTSAAEQRANLVLSTGVIITVLAAGLLLGGKLTAVDALQSAIITIFAFAGMYLGAYLFLVAPVSWFRSVALIAVLAAGLSAIAAALQSAA